jgi:hypothetical protein
VVALASSAGCGRIDYDAQDAGRDLDATSALDVALPDAPGLDAPLPDAVLTLLDAPLPDAPLLDAPLLDAPAPDAALAPDAFACPPGERLVMGRCVPPVRQLDLDGDGIGDLVIGAQQAPPSAQGAAFFYRGSATGPVLIDTFRTGNADERVGFAVVDAHDTNGDRLDDVIVSGHNFGAGSAYVFHGGSASYATATSRLTATPSSEFGQFLCGLGDVTGDAWADVVVAEDGAARLHLFRGRDVGLLTTPSATLTAPDLQQIGDGGDVDGNGRGDVVLRGVTGTEGHLYVYLSLTSAPAMPSLTIRAGAGATYTGLASARLDPDAAADVVVGTSDGTVRVHRGSATGPSAAASATLATPMGASAFGTVIANVGDLDADGDDELAIASDVGGAATVHVYAGQDADPFATRATSIPLPSAAGRTRLSLGAADVDGDGLAELVVGDPTRQHVYLYADPMGSPSLAYDLSDPSATAFGFSVASR